MPNPLASTALSKCEELHDYVHTALPLVRPLAEGEFTHLLPRPPKALLAVVTMGAGKKHGGGDDPEVAAMATMTTEAKVQQFFQETHLEGGKVVAAHELVTMRGETIGESLQHTRWDHLSDSHLFDAFAF